MVRFIMPAIALVNAVISSIYIPIWLDLLCLIYPLYSEFLLPFTFQYGQIYYGDKMSNGSNSYNIYIPIWLDLLFKTNNNQKHRRKNLHSNMVRFIIQVQAGAPVKIEKFTFQYGQIYYVKHARAHDNTSLIYIPIWLDLLSC